MSIKSAEIFSQSEIAMNVDACRQRYGIQRVFEDNDADLDRRNWKPLNTPSPVRKSRNGSRMDQPFRVDQVVDISSAFTP
jgi:hypothetical protein